MGGGRRGDGRAAEIAARVAVTLEWTGGDPDKLGRMQRSAGPEAKSICSR